MWTPDGKRLPHRFVPNENYDVRPEHPPTAAAAVDRHVNLARELAVAAQKAAEQQVALGPALKKALAGKDAAAARKTRNEMWEALYEMFSKVPELADAWNDVAPRGGTD